MSENTLTEQELLTKAQNLAKNGHRMSYIFKYLRDRTDDADMRSRIMEAIQKDQQVVEERTESLKKMDTNGKSWANLGMGLFIFALGVGVYFLLWNDGFISTLPIALMVIGAGFFLREVVK